jgi:hypothetical protein
MLIDFERSVVIKGREVDKARKRHGSRKCRRELGEANLQ